jgi:hypothetical protein
MTSEIIIHRNDARDINILLHEACCQFKMTTGENPRKAILGPVKWKAFCDMIDEMQSITVFFDTIAINPMMPVQYNGMAIYHSEQPGMTIE